MKEGDSFVGSNLSRLISKGKWIFSLMCILLLSLFLNSSSYCIWTLSTTNFNLIVLLVIIVIGFLSIYYGFFEFQNEVWKRIRRNTDVRDSIEGY